MSTLSDEELLAALATGDDSAVAEISRRYGDELRLFCHRMLYNEALAEDIVQEVLVACCRAQVRPNGSLRGWLYQVARHRAIDELRKARPRQLPAGPESRIWTDSAIPIDPVTTPAGRAIAEDRARRVQLAIDALPEDLREVIILYFFQGLSREQVAEAIGLTLSGTKARLSKATALLRRRLATLNESSS
jgi:RNA polymerase sigma-70 factor (ECF subfamily)